jgi:hypothetical protein
MTRKTRNKQKSFSVSVNFLPPHDVAESLCGYVREYLRSDCDMSSRNSNRVAKHIDRSGQVIILSPVSIRANLDDQVAALLDILRIQELLNLIQKKYGEILCCVSIGIVYSGTISCTVMISRELLSRLAAISLPIEIASYPDDS